MADEQVTETEVETPVVETDVVETTDVETPEADKPKEIDWKAMARKHEREAKANAAAAAELEKYKAKNRTAEENATKAAEEAARERDEAKAELAREKAIRKHGLTDEQASILEGIPADQYEARAAALAKLTKSTTATGPSGTEVKGAKQKASLEQQLADAHKAGNWSDAIRIKQQMYSK